MALVVLCGQPSSGKSKAALLLTESLKESDSNPIPAVLVIDETYLYLVAIKATLIWS